MTVKAKSPLKKKKVSLTEWMVLAGLLLLCAVPMLAGSFRIVQLSTAAEITADNARFFASPVPVIVHIISAILYSVVGAFQFIPTIRRPKLNWHRIMGRNLIPLGLAVAVSGLWMTLFYPWAEGDGEILYVMRLLVGIAMLITLCLGYLAIRKHDYKQHGAWMIRAYALGLGAGTQVLTHIPWFIVFGTPEEFPRALLMGAGWLINIIIAEWIIRNGLSRHKRKLTSTK